MGRGEVADQLGVSRKQSRYTKAKVPCSGCSLHTASAGKHPRKAGALRHCPGGCWSKAQEFSQWWPVFPHTLLHSVQEKLYPLLAFLQDLGIKEQVPAQVFLSPFNPYFSSCFCVNL